jgi:hypothetical protein
MPLSFRKQQKASNKLASTAWITDTSSRKPRWKRRAAEAARADNLNKDGQAAAQYVTLDQAAALVNRRKKTLERHFNNDPDAPQPDVEGGGGRAHEWRWDRLRTWLENTFSRPLPARFPSI